MRAVVTVEQLAYLLDNLPPDSSLLTALRRMKIDVKKALTPDQIDELRDLCGDLLQGRGFDEDYRPTAEGVLLEDLIDRLYVG